MKIIFMGTPDFSVECLQALIRSSHQVVGVFTREDKPKNRGMSLTMPPVKELALTYNIPVYQPKSLKSGDSYEIIREIRPDLIVVVAYGRMLPENILAVPRYGCINVHASLLPKYRGASPVQSAIVGGEDVTGVTIMQINSGMDTGDMLHKKTTNILPTDTGDTLTKRLAELGATGLMEYINMLDTNTAPPPIPQDDTCATYAKMISREDGRVSFSGTARQVANQIMGYSPWPGAFASWGQDTVKLFEAYVAEGQGEGIPPGTVCAVGSCGITVACGVGCVTIKEIQKSGGKRMSVVDFLRGKPEYKDEMFI